MENEKNTAVLNEVMVNKLESIAFDIKYYINTNFGIAQSLDEESINAFKFMYDCMVSLRPYSTNLINIEQILNYEYR